MSLPPRGAGRSRLPGRPLRLVVALTCATVLLGACASDDQSAGEEPETGSGDTSTSVPSTSATPSASGTPSGREPPASSGEQQYVALGDSYTAAPLVPETDTADPCLRSTGNYPGLIGADLGYDTTDVSCLGATSTSMVGVQRTRSTSQPAQFDALSRQTDLVTLGIGGNDIGLFTTLLQTCLPLAQQDPDGAPCADRLRGTPRDLLPAVRDLDERIEAIVAGVRGRAPRAQVVVVTYPQPLPADGTCEAAPLADGDYDYIRRVSTQLSRAISAGAEAADADVVDMLRLSRGHDICSDEPWVNGVQTDPTQALAFHPFAVEQQAVADDVARLVEGA